MKFLIYTFFFILFLPQIFSVNECVKSSDEFIVSCSIPKHFFEQEFTCLSNDCSDRLVKGDGYLDLYIDEVLKDQIFHNNIPLTEITDNIEVINYICKEQLNKEHIKYIKEKLDYYENFKWEFVGGDKFAITPHSKNSELTLESKIKEDKKRLGKCYSFEVKNVDGWLIQEKVKKPYCATTYDDGNACFVTSIGYFPFIIYLITNPSWTTFAYLISLIISAFAIYVIFDSSYYLYKNKEFEKFFKLNKNKGIQSSILIVPFIYVYGKFTNFLINKNYYLSVDALTEIFVILFGAFFLYFLVCLVNYMAEKNKVIFLKKKKRKKRY